MKIINTLILLLSVNILFAQNSKDSVNPKTNNFKKNAVFVELAGSSFFGASINYQRNLYLNKNISLSGNIGAGLFVIDVNSPLFPVRITINWKRLEFGFGVSNCVHFGSYNDGMHLPKTYGFKYKYYEDGSYTYRLFLINPHPIIGYNFIKKKNIFMRVSFSSIAFFNGDSESLSVSPMIGLSSGFSF